MHFTPTRRHTREGGYPVRRGLSIQLLTSLEYWITGRIGAGDDSGTHRLTGIFLNFTLFPSACRVAM